MTAKKLKTVNVAKNDYKIFLGKAKDFYEVMLSARETGNWTAVGLNAVHCAISCCDAMLTFHLGIRSSGEDHMQAVDLLLRLPPDVEEGEANTFKRIIVKKSIIAYECREFRQAEALDILKLAERFYRWTTSKLPAL
jgi:HEPN domain-containing protein